MYNNRTKRRMSMLVPLLVWLACAAYMGMNLKRGWVPWDEGILGQSAERVLNGEMPHKDFAEVYTGGLSYLNALVFRLFGINLMYLRYVLFGFFLVWVPAVYALAREFLEPWIAGGVTLLAVAWSVPNYPAAMPSWFLLFFATFGTLALSRYINRPKMHWLILAGLCGGLSFLFKSLGIYFIAAGLLFLIFREQDLSQVADGRPQRTPTYTWFLAGCMTVLVLLLVKLVMFRGGVAEFLHFVLPSLAIALLLVGRERTLSKVGSKERFSNLFATAGPFLAAAVLPVALYFLFYWWHGGLMGLIRGLFILPFRRIHYAYFEAPDSVLELPALFAAFILFVAARLAGRARSVLSLLIALVATLLFFTSRKWNPSYLIGLYSLRGIVPAIVITMLIFRFGKTGSKADKMDERTFLLFAVTSLFSLIQFPFAAPIYFSYVAPLAILLLAKLIYQSDVAPKNLVCAGGLFYLCFAIFIFKSYAMSDRFIPVDEDVPLTLARAGNIRVSHQQAAQYEVLIPFVQTLAGSSPIIAGPDCPEVYFLAGLRNPTPFLLEFLDTSNYAAEMQTILDQPNFIKVVVINTEPAFSSYARDQLIPLADKYFVESRKIGSFQVYWGHK